MSLNPLNELKRRLNDEEIKLPKRICLAKNVIQSHHFPSAPKERVIADWLQDLIQNKTLKGQELKNVLDWLNTCDDLGSELKTKLVRIVAEYIKTNPLQDSDIHMLISLIENDKIKTQLNSQLEEYLTVTITLLQYMRNNHEYALLPERIFNNLMKYYKESKKKLEFIIKLLNGENIETLFSYLKTDYHNSVINVCNSIFFPLNKRSNYISYLQTLIRKDNLNALIAEKGDNIQSVLKIMNVLFEFPKGRADLSIDFIKHFIDVFVSCYHTESQIIFAFYIMVANFLGLQQHYILPAMNLPTVNFGSEKEEKTKRVLFLNMLETLLTNEVDISVRLTDNFGVKISKVELNKTFILFLQEVMLNHLKLESKPDKTTIEIIKIALKLDPTLIEQIMDQILPPLMTAKKNNSKVLEAYTDMLNCLLETLFKLTKGITFVNRILPNLKINLESTKIEHLELNNKLLEDVNDEKIKSKIITGNDIFPKECAEFYGKLTSELMFRQNKELLVLLQNDLEIHCLMMLEEGSVSPSVVTIAEVLSAILSSFLRHSKIADHTVPLPIAEEFWNVFKAFQEEYLRRFGECILKMSYNSSLAIGFLNICLSVAQLKLLNIKYSNVKLDMSISDTSEIYDLNALLPCLRKEQWIELASRINDDEAVLIMDHILLIKRTITELLALKDTKININGSITQANTHFVKRISTNAELLDDEYFTKALFNLDKKQYKELSKSLFKIHMTYSEKNIFEKDFVKSNRLLQNSLVLEVSRNITKCFDNSELLAKALSKNDFNTINFAKENSMRNLFENLSLKSDNEDVMKCYVDLLGELQIAHLDENYQLVAIFVMLAIKKCCQTKKIKRNINKILQATYELSLLPPDLYQIFTTDFVFEFDNSTIIDLLTLKKCNNDLFIVKCLIESAVKRVKTDSNLVTSLVEILLRKKIKNNKSIAMFNDPVFQISCVILPLIVKQKKVITASIHRSILADLQDKLQKELLESFKNIDFTQIRGMDNNSGNTENILVDNNMAVLNAMAAYSLTLSRYCETINAEEIRNLECLWSGLEFFTLNAIHSISNPSSKLQHMEYSIQLFNTILRYIKKLETHDIFKEKDKIFIQIWRSLKSRLTCIIEENNLNTVLEDISVTLKYLCEFCSVECFCSTFIDDIDALSVLKKPTEIIKDTNKSDVKSHKVAKFLLTQCLKANIVGPKCVAMTKMTYNKCRNLRFWLRQHYEDDSVANRKKRKFNIYNEDGHDEKKIIKIDDGICNLIRIDLDSLSEVILAAKRITLDYKYLDNIFELHHMIYCLMGYGNNRVHYDISWQAFFSLYEGCVSTLNGLIVSREEMLEDRWPCFMQCYRALVTLLSERSSAQNQLERSIEEKLAEVAHSIEKLTQSISKRKKHVSRICAYTVADMCALIEKKPPMKNVRQHMENSIALLIQACDSSYAMSFLKRALAASPGQVTVANMYLNYKRYHKYVGNA